MKALRIVLGLSVLGMGLLATGVPAATAASGPYCGITWGSQLKSTTAMSDAPIVNARVGRHECYDRLVIDLAGKPAPGYFVRYTAGFHEPGSGTLIPTRGGAVLSIQALAPGYDDNWQSTTPWRPGDHIARPNFKTIKDVAYGGSFEGESAFGLGVRARLPFRVLQLDGPGGGSRLVIDVAHRW